MLRTHPTITWTTLWHGRETVPQRCVICVLALTLVKKERLSKSAFKVSRKWESIPVAYSRCVGPLGMRMCMDEPEDPPGQVVFDLVGTSGLILPTP